MHASMHLKRPKYALKTIICAKKNQKHTLNFKNF